MEMAVSGQKFTRPANLLNSIFMFTVNAAAKTLVSVASDTQSGNAEKWRLGEHLRFMAMLMTWFAVWVLKVLMDYFPCCTNPSNPYSVCLYGSTPLGRMSHDHLSQSPLSSALISFPCLDMVDGTPSVKALERALSQIFALINQIPATSRKYTFAMAMANKIMDENARFGHVEFLEINRTALASAFARTSTRLHSSLERTRAEVADADDSLVGFWATRLMQVLPMGSYLTSCVKTVGTCVNAVVSSLANENSVSNPRQIVLEGQVEEIWAEKLAQELLWMTYKLKECGAVEEAMIQWSYASDLASLSLDAHPRVQGFILKISGLLLEELSVVEVKIERGVKFRLLWLWLPLLCHAGNGVAYPVLSSYEKAGIERSMEQAIASLPALDQEVILSNWFHDFTVSASDWPNLQFSYDRWCQHTRQLIHVI